MEALAGETELEAVAVGGVPEGAVGALAVLPYPLGIHPRIEERGRVAGSNRSVTLLGVDLVAHGAALLQGKDGTDAGADALPGPEGEAPRALASEDLGVPVGGTFELVLNSRAQRILVGGRLPASAGAEDLVVLDIADAQRIVERKGVVDRILIDLPRDESAGDGWIKRLRAVLPEGVEVRERGTATGENRKMLAAFRWNLRVLSYVALVVGAFLIYNTISVSVVRRRPEIGIARALGASRFAVTMAFLAEGAFFGLAGGIAGLPLGRVMASGAVLLMSTTVQSLYVTSRPAPIDLTPPVAALALGIGFLVAVASALSPAREAARVSPVLAMAKAERETTAAVHRWRDLAVAAVLGVVAAIASQAPPVGRTPLFGYLSALLLVGTCAFAIPALVHSVQKVSARALRRALGIEAMLASRSLAASLRRTSVLVGALATAIAMMVAVGIMVGSFRLSLF
jgi:putative ABC transport system permease protein